MDESSRAELIDESMIDLFALNLECTSEWRREKAERYPNDNRNLPAAEKLSELASQVRQLKGHLEKFVLSGCEVRCLGEKRFSRVLKGALSRSRGWVALAKECLRRRWAPAWWRCALSPAMRAWPSAPGRPIG